VIRPGLFLIALAAALIAGCASLPGQDATEALRGPSASAEQLKRFALSGRIAVRQGENGQYGNLRWIRSGDGDELTLLNPLGQTAAVLKQDKGGVSLILGERQYHATDGEALTQQVLGYTLPVNGLGYWILGMASPDSPAEVQRRPNGTTVALAQNGWQIDYPDYLTVDGTLMPKRVFLRRGDLDIKLVIDDWRLGAQEP
jgi:outer membrane lipoprotein LolB